MIDFDPIINKTYTFIRKKSNSFKNSKPFFTVYKSYLKKMVRIYKRIPGNTNLRVFLDFESALDYMGSFFIAN